MKIKLLHLWLVQGTVSGSNDFTHTDSYSPWGHQPVDSCFWKRKELFSDSKWAKAVVNVGIYRNVGLAVYTLCISSCLYINLLQLPRSHRAVAPFSSMPFCNIWKCFLVVKKNVAITTGHFLYQPDTFITMWYILIQRNTFYNNGTYSTTMECSKAL